MTTSSPIAIMYNKATRNRRFLAVVSQNYPTSIIDASPPDRLIKK